MDRKTIFAVITIKLKRRDIQRMSTGVLRFLHERILLCLQSSCHHICSVLNGKKLTIFAVITIKLKRRDIHRMSTGVLRFLHGRILLCLQSSCHHICNYPSNILRVYCDGAALFIVD